MDCYDHNPDVLRPIIYFLELLDGADDITSTGMDIYEYCSRLARMSGLRDFDPWLMDATMTPAARALRQKQIADVLRILGHLDGELTTVGQQTVVRELWRGGATDAFVNTLGEMYGMRHVQFSGMPARAASRLGRPAGHGFLYLAQVNHVAGYGRRYDIVVIARRAGDQPDLRRVDIDDDVVMRVEIKWYLSTSTTADTSHVRGELLTDLVQSYHRGLDFRDLFYGVPASNPGMLANLADVVRSVFEYEFTDYLATQGSSPSVATRLSAALDEHLDAGEMVFAVADEVDALVPAP